MEELFQAYFDAQRELENSTLTMQTLINNEELSGIAYDKAVAAMKHDSIVCENVGRKWRAIVSPRCKASEEATAPVEG